MADEPEEQIVRAVLDSPTLIAVARQLSLEKTAREGRALHAEVHSLDLSTSDRPTATIGAGMVVLLVSTEPDLLTELRESLTRGDYERIDTLIRSVIAKSGELKPSHYAPVADAAHIVDVALGSRPLAENILLEDQASYVDLYPFMGGRIDTDGARVTAFSLRDAGEHVGVILLVSQPELSDVERAALAALPSGQEPIVGDGVVGFLPAAWAVARGAWAAYIVGKYLYKEYKQHRAWREGRIAQTLGGDQLARKDVPAGATVAELLDARSQIMRDQLGQGQG